MTNDLIRTARILAGASPNKPRQAELKRAISTAYYALFHTLAQDAADRLIGTGKGRSNEAWAQVYRALQHGLAKEACQRTSNLGFPSPIIECADAFVDLQEARHAADYDPDKRVTRNTAQEKIDLAEIAIRKLRSAPKSDRKAFAVLLLLQKRT